MRNLDAEKIAVDRRQYRRSDVMSQVIETEANISRLVVQMWAKFLRTNYGAEARNEAQRHIVAYMQENRRDLAEIWSQILDDIQKTEGFTKSH
jgi:hypothetical protein